jgi:hypothetical protein
MLNLELLSRVDRRTGSRKNGNLTQILEQCSEGRSVTAVVAASLPLVPKELIAPALVHVDEPTPLTRQPAAELSDDLQLLPLRCPRISSLVEQSVKPLDASTEGALTHTVCERVRDGLVGHASSF